MKIKQAVATRFIQQYTLNESLKKTHLPKAGDVALFRVLEIGRHKNIQGVDKRLQAILEGDTIMASFANRYATSQFEGYVPDAPQEVYDILGAGGAIGILKSKNAALKDDEPTKVELIGYCCDDDGQVINSLFYHTPRIPFEGQLPGDAKVILSIGATMDSGKTTTAAFTARGLKMQGYRVGFIKLTGTAHTKDKDFVFDCGADYSFDFSDAGFPSTFLCTKETILDIYQTLLNMFLAHPVDYIVMEIADGILQKETDFLIKDAAFMKTIHNTIFSCGDSLSALKGLELLNKIGIHPSLISGKFTMSPLLIREVQAITEVPIHTIEEIMTGSLNSLLTNTSVGVANA